MHEEAAFLAQLDDDPDDDTTRLVYADWLDERGDARAAFLRLDLAVARMAQTTSDAEAELDRLRESIDAAWVERVGKRSDLLLHRYSFDRKIHAIRVFRLLTGVGLYEGKCASEAVPNCVYVATLRYKSPDWRHAFPDFPGDRVEVELVPTTFTRPIYSVLVSGCSREYIPGVAEHLARVQRVPYADALRRCHEGHFPIALRDNLLVKEALAHRSWISEKGGLAVIRRAGMVETALTPSAGIAGPAPAS